MFISLLSRSIIIIMACIRLTDIYEAWTAKSTYRLYFDTMFLYHENKFGWKYGEI